MRKHFLILTTLCLACCSIFAGIVTVPTAQTVALNFFKNNLSSISTTNPSTATLVFTKSESDGTADFYVFNISPSKGFVIVSAEDNAQPILGYSNESNFSANFNGIGLSDWMTTTASKIRNIVQQQVMADMGITNLWSAYKVGTVIPSSSRASTVSPLMTTTWDQYPYYNALCPYNSANADNAVTGCVATAMAQIMKFWNFPVHGTGSYSYNDAPPSFSYNYGTQSANFGATTYQWSKMPTAATGPGNDTAIATLMYQCGVAVAMDYGDIYEGGSGAYVMGGAPSAQSAYSTYFGYNANTIQGLTQSSYTSANWISLLQNELLAGRPLQYEGFDPSAGGHTWVCDGFDVNSNFHMNWGWGGIDNGYFNISSLSVEGYNFTSDDGALIGIEPGNVVSCGTPSGLTSSSVTTSSATVAWTAVSGAVSYNLQYKTSSASTWSTVSVTNTSNALTGLTAGTTYNYQVQTVCSGGSSSFSTAGTFTTSTSCGTPSGLTSSSITSSGATVSWGAVTGASSYNLEYKTSSASTWTTVSVTNTSDNLTGLTSGTLYDFQVQCVCASGSSAYSAQGSFTTSTPPTCATPTGLNSSSITTAGATVSWTAVTGAVSYNLQYKTSSASTWSTISVTSSSGTLTGLTAGTIYNYQVQTVCSSGSSAYSTSGSFTTLTSGTSYCTSLGSSTEFEYIENVSLGTINNTTAALGYSDYTSQSTNLTIGAPVSISLTPGFLSSIFTEYFTVYIDYNHNGSFTDAGDLVAEISGSAKTTASVTVPASALTGSTRMRIQMQYGSYETNPCATFSFGAVQDYTVNIVSSVACNVPTGLNSSSVTTTGATVGWGAVSGANSYNLQYKTSSASTWTTASVTGTSFNLTGLASNITYNYQVQTICSSGSSAYSTASSFTTLTPCGTPAGLTSSSITTTGATVSWGAVSGATSYNLEYKTSSASTWTTVTVSSASYNLTGLASNTTYNYQVQTICSSGSSAYSTAGSFTTLTPCGTPAGLTASSISTTGATVSWGAVSGATSYNLEYKTSSASTWTTVAASSASYNLTGLVSGTTYNYQVQTVCSSGPSAYSTAGSFTTLTPCGTPAGLTASSISTTGATVSWGAVSGATSYNLEYKTSSASTWTTVSIASASYNLTGLVSSTTYDFQVQTICSSGPSAYSAEGTFTTNAAVAITYCTLTGGTQFEYINEVAFGSFSNVSGNSGGYANFTNMVVPLTTGLAKSFTLTPGYNYGSWPEGWAIYIDYNKNGLFTDPGEEVFVSAPTTGSLSGTINVPSGLNGTTVMRIAMEYEGDASSCGSYSFGAVQDYTVNLSATALLLPGEDVTPAPSPVAEAPVSLIYPNPASDQLRVKLIPVADLQTKIEILSIMGQTVLTQMTASGDREANINIVALPAGVYLVRMTIGDRTITQKMIKQ